MKEIAFQNSYARLPEAFAIPTRPAQVPNPTLIRLNSRLCRQLGVDAEWLGSDAGVSMLAGNILPESAEPLAMAYGGHQFGGWSPRLGDGRAILLGELVHRNGIRRDLQLKGSGRTPFSRSGDGKATLGAVLREYVLSEAMFALGVPTTRALAAVATGEEIYRETKVPGAVLTRVAQSHVRVGTFQYFYAQDDHKSLHRLADYIIERHYPEAMSASNPYLALLEGVVERQARLIARWMQIGFIHGVMNTDNTQIAGETIDYGPCAFMDNFHPERVFSSIDRQGRYAWNQQPAMGHWNLSRLAESLLTLIDGDEAQALAKVEPVLASFGAHYDEAFLSGFRRKLGLIEKKEEDVAFLSATFVTMAEQEVDFTLFFRRLTQVAEGAAPESLLALFQEEDKGRAWLANWRVRLKSESTATKPRSAIMQGVNPIFIARNHRVEEAIDHAQEGDFEPFNKLVQVLSRPYQEQPEHAEYERAPTPEQRVKETFCNT